MVAGKNEETALGSARGRFLESLPRKAIELRGAIALLTATPGAEGPREDMRRRLHTLYASAMVFRNDVLAAAVKEGIDCLDAARSEARPLNDADLELLAKLVKRLPELRGDAGIERLSSPPLPREASTPPAGEPRRPRTLTGLAPVSDRPSDASSPPVPQGEPVFNVLRPPGSASSASAGRSNSAVLASPASSTPQAGTSASAGGAGKASEASAPASGDAHAASPEPSSAAPESGDEARPTVVPPPDFMMGMVASEVSAERQAVATGALAAARPASGGAITVVPPSAEPSAPLVLARNQRPLLQRVLQVLVLPAPGEADALRSLLDNESLVLTFADTARDAVHAAHDDAPDVVVADERLAHEGQLLSQLRADPLTDYVPVVLLADSDAAPSDGEAADERVRRPVPSDHLVRVIGRVTGTLVEAGGTLSALGDVTLEEVAERIADEVRRGLVDAVERGRELRVPLGDGAEVLAAAWDAITRVRTLIGEQSGGRVRFSDRALPSGPALLALDAQAEAELTPEPKGLLRGRRVLVVDDDPAVVWFYTHLLREEGATLFEASDGEAALRVARRERPDVVISDVLMPKLDGFALCRELKRDPALADLPVILISWRDDLLARMRELSSGASGYLRKEASAAQVLESLKEVLAPRARLEADLAGEGDVRGSLEGIGVVSLLRSVRRVRPDARVTVRDAWNLFECELRGGRLVQVTRTASDGSFVRGEKALPQLLGAAAGRFSVSVAQAPVKAAFEGTLDEELTRGARELGAQLDALSHPLIARIARVVFDEDAYLALLDQSPRALRHVVERLHAGESPLKLVKQGHVAQATLEAVLLDMGRRGAIRGVVGSAGEDLFAEARALRAREEPASSSIVPEPPNPVISVLPTEEQADAPEASPNLIPVPAAFSAAGGQAASAAATTAAPGDAETKAPEVQAKGGEEAPRGESVPRGTFGAAEASPEAADEHATKEGAAHGDAGAVALRAAPSKQAEGPSEGAASQSSEAPSGEARAEAAERAEGGAEAATPPAPATEVRKPPPVETPEPDPTAAEERRSRTTIVAWAIALSGLCAAAFFAERALGPEIRHDQVELIGAHEATGAEPEPGLHDETSASVGVAPLEGASIADGKLPSPAAPPTDLPADPAFKEYNGILEPGLVNDPSHGLLLVEAQAAHPAAVLSVSGKELGRLPAKVALPPGVHEIALRVGDAVSYRYVSVRSGKTWVLRGP